MLIEERNMNLLHLKYPDQMNNWNLKIIDLFEANIVDNIDLGRVGSKNDGGYFLPTSFLSSRNWITIGLGSNIEFENDLCSRDSKVVSFDHTILGRPRQLNPKVRYFKLGWGTENKRNKLVNLESMLKIAEFTPIDSVSWCLKFDIEGNEWELMHQIHELVNKPALIICELHNLIYRNSGKLVENMHETLIELFKEYIACSIHGNNYSIYVRDKDYGIYDIAEVTLVRRDLVETCQVRSTQFRVDDYRNIEQIIQMPIGRFTL
jgi:hypothetical protein